MKGNGSPTPSELHRREFERFHPAPAPAPALSADHVERNTSAMLALNETLRTMKPQTVSAVEEYRQRKALRVASAQRDTSEGIEGDRSLSRVARDAQFGSARRQGPDLGYA